MPRYYFDIHKNEQVVPDLDGVEMPDLAAAVDEAHFAAREMIAEAIKADRPSVLRYAFEIADGDGSTLYRVKFIECINRGFSKLQP
jgi:hypothetical protein